MALSAAVAPDRAASSASRAVTVERLDTAASILAAASNLAANDAATGFQTATWLDAVYRHLVPAAGGVPLGLAVRCASTGTPLGLLPLYAYRHGRLTVAKFADCGVSDYNALVTTDPANADGISVTTILAAIKTTCRDVDILALERMPSTEPLAHHPAATPSRLSGNTLTIATTVDDFIHARGKKYRKEAERSFRVLQSHGAWSFQRAETTLDIASAFAALETQQAERHGEASGHYALAAPQFAAFYSGLLLNAPDSAHIFTLKVEGTIIAALLGITHGTTFTLLRTSNAGDAWRQVSPGRLIVIEAMRYFCARGVTTFDMGIGDYAFKRGFGTVPIELTDLVVPLSWRATPTVAAHRFKQRLRESPRLRSAVQAIKARLNASRS